MSARPLRVIKLGGSLLESQDWCARFVTWHSALPPGRTLLIVGGGPPVDAIRALAGLHDYPTEFLHWLCIDAMDISYRLVEQQLTWPGVRSQQELQTWLEARDQPSALAHPQAFYRRDNYWQLPIDLPISWDTTSDSLAALLAHVALADELIVVKSCAVHEPYDWIKLGQSGVVDVAFSKAVSGLTNVRLSTL